MRGNFAADEDLVLLVLPNACSFALAALAAASRFDCELELRSSPGRALTQRDRVLALGDHDQQYGFRFFPTDANIRRGVAMNVGVPSKVEKASGS